MEQLVARRAHNPKVIGSSPVLATTKTPKTNVLRVFLFNTRIILEMVFFILSNLNLYPIFSHPRTKKHSPLIYHEKYLLNNFVYLNSCV